MSQIVWESVQVVGMRIYFIFLTMKTISVGVVIINFNRGGIMCLECGMLAYCEKKKQELEENGNKNYVININDFVIEAKNEDEAKSIALEMIENHAIDFNVEKVEEL